MRAPRLRSSITCTWWSPAVAPSAGCALAGVDHIEIGRVEIGRGDARALKRDGATLRFDVPDPYMSSVHVRFERDAAQWVAADAGSRNGMLVNGVKHTRIAVTADDVVEVGRSFFMVREGERAGTPVLDFAVAPDDPLATLDPALAARFVELRKISESLASGKDRVNRARANEALRPSITAYAKAVRMIP